MDNKLKKCGVEYDSAAHTYHFLGEQFKGITGAIKKYITHNDYAQFNADAVEKKRARGSMAHSEIEKFVKTGTLPDFPLPETSAILDATKDIKFIDAEYVVTDYISHASPVDIIDDNYNLYDIKTTSTLDVEFVKWQLSIYKMLFQVVNGFDAGDLFVLWVRQKGDSYVCEKIQLQPILPEYCAQLLKADASDSEFINPLEEKESICDEPAQKLALLLRQKKDIDAEIENLKNAIGETLKQNNLNGYHNETLNFSIVRAHSSDKFDETAFKNDYPEIYKKYVNTRLVKESIKVALK